MLKSTDPKTLSHKDFFSWKVKWIRFFGWTMVNWGWCNDLNKNGPYRLMCLNAWPIGSGPSIRRCSLHGLGVALIKEACQCASGH